MLLRKNPPNNTAARYSNWFDYYVNLFEGKLEKPLIWEKFIPCFYQL